jgi:histidinol dehydrogenase
MKLIRTKGRGAEKRQRPCRARTARRRGARSRAARRQAHRRRCAQAGRSRSAALRCSIRRPHGAPLRVTQQEMAAAWEAIDPALRDGLSTAARQIRAFAVGQLPPRGANPSLHPRPHHRPACAPARLGRLLCAQRPSSAALHAADDRDSRAGGGRRAHRGCLAQARAWRLSPPRICSASRSSIASAERTPWPRWPMEPQSIPRVDKIVGPGNLYVTAAKRLVALTAPSTCSPAPRRSSSPASAATRRDRLRPGRAGRARSRSAGHLHHHARRSGQRSHRRSQAAQPQQCRRARGS